MIDDEEIVKALSLEEKALDEFKRKRMSNSHQHPTFSRSFEGKTRNSSGKIINKYLSN